MKIAIKKLVDWGEVYDSALFTQRKEVGDKKPTSKWKLKTCYAGHSILRDLMFSIKIEDVESFIISHLIRHKREYTQPYVQTLREDLTGIPNESVTRLTKNGVKFILNAKSIIDISRVRLCNKASIETILVWKEVLKELEKIEPELTSICVPQCVEKGMCTEYKTCGFDESKKFDEIREDYTLKCILNNRKIK